MENRSIRDFGVSSPTVGMSQIDFPGILVWTGCMHPTRRTSPPASGLRGGDECGLPSPRPKEPRHSGGHIVHRTPWDPDSGKAQILKPWIIIFSRHEHWYLPKLRKPLSKPSHHGGCAGSSFPTGAEATLGPDFFPRLPWALRRHVRVVGQLRHQELGSVAEVHRADGAGTSHHTRP